MLGDKISKVIGDFLAQSIRDIHGQKHTSNGTVGSSVRDYEWNELTYLQQVATLAVMLFWMLLLGGTFAAMLVIFAGFALLVLGLLYLLITEMTWLAITIAVAATALFVIPLFTKRVK